LLYACARVRKATGQSSKMSTRGPCHTSNRLYTTSRAADTMPGMTTNGFTSYFHPRWLIIALLSMLGVLALTHIPQDALPRVFQHRWHDKLEHFVAYGVVGASLMLSLRRPVRLPLFLAILCALAAIGALDEITQPLVRRHASILDYAADLVGIAAACSVLLVRRLPWFSAPSP